MGNHGEVVRTAAGAYYEVVGAFEHLHVHHPSVTICAELGEMQVAGRKIKVRQVRGFSGNTPRPTPGQAEQRTPQASGTPIIEVVLRIPDCGCFIADGPQGYYLLEWYAGYDPRRGDGIFGELSSYGLRDVLYGEGQEGSVYVEDYLLSRKNAVDNLRRKCR